jgi:Short C-terminal domain
MTQRPETPLKDLAGTLRTILRSNKAAADALVQIQEIEALAEDRLRPLLPELRVIKDDALTAARELDTAKLGELTIRLRDLVARAGTGHDPRHASAADAGRANGSQAAADAAARLAAGHTSYPTDRILPLAAPAADPAAEIDLHSPKRVAEALFHLHELLAAGVLDQAEYDAKKQELLDRL